MSITVNVIGQTNIVTSITNSDTVEVGVGTMAAQTLTSLAIAGGANVTVTTTSGVFTIIGRDPPVTSVNGKTGVVTLVASEVGAASASHTHVAANVTDFATEAAKYGPVSSVNGKTGTVTLVATDVTAASATHAHSYVQTLNGQTGTVTITAGANVTVTTSAGVITIAAAAATGSGNVLSVNGRTGVVVLNSTDVSAASVVHTHVAANITDFAAEAAKYGPVSSVNGRTGTVTMVALDVSAASASHTHVVANITDFASEAAKYGPVSSVNGKTGTVTLVASDVSAASASHTHVAANITDFAAEAAKYGPVSSVNGRTGTVTLVALDVSAASASHTHLAANITDLTSVANVISVNGQTGVVTVTAGGGGTAASVATKTLTTNVNNYDSGTTDIVRVEATANMTITGVAGGSSGAVKLFVNVSTNELTLASASTASDSSNRFIIVGGDRVLGEGDSASAFYDATSQRWRLVGHEPAAPGFLWATIDATATISNYAPGSATVLRVNPDQNNRQITGFTGGGQNKALRVVNISTHSLKLVHNSNGSDVENRILVDTGTDRTLEEHEQAELLYDPVSLRWRVTPCCGGAST